VNKKAKGKELDIDYSFHLHVEEGESTAGAKHVSAERKSKGLKL